jgi:hypothetical protein
MNKLTLVCLIGLLTLGCAGSSIKFPNAQGEMVSIKHDLGGRGCIAVTTENGEVAAVVQQDGSSDWSGVRVIPSLAQIAGAIFGGAREPQPYPSPSDIQGCAGIFVDTPEE